jgi:xylulokinase
MRGAWAGLDARHDRDALAWSALEGVAFGVADAYEALTAAAPATRAATEIRLAGGGSLAPAWRQLLADVLGTPLRPVEVPDASARGAALLGARAAGLPIVADTAAPEGAAARVEPRPAPVLTERRRLWLDAVHALRPLPFHTDSPG